MSDTIRFDAEGFGSMTEGMAGLVRTANETARHQLAVLEVNRYCIGGGNPNDPYQRQVGSDKIVAAFGQNVKELDDGGTNVVRNLASVSGVLLGTDNRSAAGLVRSVSDEAE